MANWLGQASQDHGMYRQDLEVMDSNPGQIELRVRIMSIKVILESQFILVKSTKVIMHLQYIQHWPKKTSLLQLI